MTAAIGEAYIQPRLVMEPVEATPVSPKNADADAEKGDGEWEGRRRSGRKRMQRVLFTKIPDSDSDANFHKTRDNAGGKRKKEGIADLPVPIFQKKSKKEKKKNDADGKKRKKSSNGDGESGSGTGVAPIFSDKDKGCRKDGTAAGILMEVPSDAHQTHSWPSSDPSSSQPDDGWRPIRTGHGGRRGGVGERKVCFVVDIS